MWSDIPNDVQHRWLEEDSHVTTFETAVAAVINGEWDEARESLASITAPDRAAEFYRRFLADSPASPPANWDGVLNMTYGGQVRQS